MNITFIPLLVSHFPLLLKWLETPHVKAWWDQDIQWSLELITKKYSPYINSNKLYAFIIAIDNIPVGYIQLYDAYAFPRSSELTGLPKSLAAIDLYIGESQYLNRNIASNAMQLLLEQYSDKFEYAFVDPDLNNHAAIKAYTKAGFIPFKTNQDSDELWMIRPNTHNN